MTTMLEIICRDPVVARDGRPFGVGQGNRMRSLDWPLPSVLAGSLRTTLGKSADRDFSVETAKDLLQVEVAGPLPQAKGKLYFPAPEDCVVHPKLGPLQAKPRQPDKGGCDWPEPGLLPVEVQTPDDFKPEAAPSWWPVDRYAEWLVRDRDATEFGFNDQFLLTAKIDDRIHASIGADSGAAEESQLFSTAALALTYLPRHRAAGGSEHSLSASGPQRVPNGAMERQKFPRGFAEIALSVRVRASDWCADAAAKLDMLHPLGGERHLVHWKATNEANAWNCPEKVCAALTATSRVRMVLATPAIFVDPQRSRDGGGWKPRWLSDDLIGTPPGANVRLRLVGVSIRRWRAVSGWSLADLPGQPRGPKPVKRMVPAGGVYFFETDGDASRLAERWLEPVSDDEQDRRDGFGLAIWGVW